MASSWHVSRKEGAERLIRSDVWSFCLFGGCGLLNLLHLDIRCFWLHLFASTKCIVGNLTWLKQEGGEHIVDVLRIALDHRPEILTCPFHDPR